MEYSDKYSLSDEDNKLIEELGYDFEVIEIDNEDLNEFDLIKLNDDENISWLD